MKKTLFLLAILLNSHLQASQPTTQDIIQLPRGLSCSVGLNNIPRGVLLLMSRFLFGTTDKNKFLLAKKGRVWEMMEVNYTYSDVKNNQFISDFSNFQKIMDQTNMIQDALWIARSELDYPRPKMMYSIPRETICVYGYTKTFGEFTHIDEIFWISEKDCLCLERQEERTRCCEVSFLGKFSCIQPYKLRENMMMYSLYSKDFYKKIVTKYYLDHGVKHEYIASGNKGYYKLRKCKKDLYAHTQIPSYNHFHTFEQVTFQEYD